MESESLNKNKLLKITNCIITKIKAQKINWYTIAIETKSEFSNGKEVTACFFLAVFFIQLNERKLLSSELFPYFKRFEIK